MTINSEYIQKLMKLAKISASSDVQKSTARQIRDIMKIIEEIQDVEISDSVQESGQKQYQLLRKDLVTESIDVQKMQQNTQSVADQFFIVPKVID